MATGSEDKTVKIYRVSGGSFSLVKTLADHSSWVLSVSFSPDGRYLATGSHDGTIVYSLQTEKSAILVKSVKFIDTDGNGVLTGTESGRIEVVMQNVGKGSGINIQASVKIKNPVSGLNISSSATFGDISPGETKTYSIPVSSTIDLQAGTVPVEISFTEGSNFPIPKQTVNIITKPYPAPKLVLTLIPSKQTIQKGKDVVDITLRVKYRFEYLRVRKPQIFVKLNY